MQIRAGDEADIADLWLVSAAGGTPSKLTAGDQADSSPRWSPDGLSIAFLSARSGKEAKQQVWRIDPHGGEAEPLTSAPGGVGAFVWSPDGAAIAFVALDAPIEEFEQRTKETGGVIEVEVDTPCLRLWVLDIQSCAARQMTSGPSTGLRTGERHAVHLTWSTSAHFDWSPDGEQIVVALAPSPNFDDMLYDSNLFLVDVATGDTRPLLERPGSHLFPRWSPDGAFIACFSSNAEPEWVAEQDVWLLSADGESTLNLTGGRARGNILDVMSFGLLHWTPDSRALLFADGRGMNVHLFRVDLAGNLEQISQGEGVHVNFSFDRTATRAVYSSQDIGRPPDLVVEDFRALAASPGPRAQQAAPLPLKTLESAGASKNPRKSEPAAQSPSGGRRLTEINPQLAEFAMGHAEVIRWQGDDGLEIEGLLVLPEGYLPGRRVPLLLGIHGGPQGVIRRNFWLWSGPRYPFPFRRFAGMGYALLLPNPRGSGCYTPAFTRANVGDWGGGDYRDIMAGVDRVIALGIADPDRLAVLGWSYGGYMAAWMVSQTDRFRAACVGAGPVNHVSMYGQTDIPRFVSYYFGADYWDAISDYTGRSPLSFASAIRAPVLIHHGEKDERVPLPQSRELYRVLKVRGVPVEMAVYSGAGHALTDPRHQRYAMQRTDAWITARVPLDQEH